MIEVADKNSWNKFIADNSSPSSFLQSWQWGQFQEALGNKVYRLSLDEKIYAQVIVKKLPLGRSYLEIPKGPILFPSPGDGEGSRACPVLDTGERSIWEAFVKQLQKLGQQEKAVLARINPPYQNFIFPPSPPAGEGWGEGGISFCKPEILIHQREPEHTILVDLSKSEDELLQNMHEKARYNIRLAQKKGVTVRDATADKEAFEKFLNLLEETTKRDKIVSWPRNRFWKFRDKFMSHNFPSPGDGEGSRERSNIPSALLLVGERNAKILAASIIMLFGDAGTYLYAASSGEERTANVPSLVLWEAIRVAKRAGKHWYDMWGIAPDSDPNHPWAGITRFKSRYVKIGVTGEETRNIGARDLVLDKKFYVLFKIGKKILG